MIWPCVIGCFLMFGSIGAAFINSFKTKPHLFLLVTALIFLGFAYSLKRWKSPIIAIILFLLSFGILIYTLYKRNFDVSQMLHVSDLFQLALIFVAALAVIGTFKYQNYKE